ncbi:shikimate dehydrogenase [Dendrosporobacter sp. 1207_IL3150]|uniref:shikimate dehydrogenase n=1 Tax=Dendrosporobacter sp. 1207_IL3150 TaxID=3084054 RepID=UPI002FDA5A10
MVTGKTKCLGILGWPVEHSFSPQMQNAAFKSAGLDYTYVPLAVHPEQLSKAVNGLKALSFVGANVTIPHKVTIMSYLDELDQSAKMVGAVNTIVIRDNKAYGHNTDACGFIQSLLKRGVTLSGKHAVILGAGGAARAVIWGLIEQGIASVSIGVRNVEKAQDLMNVFTPFANISAYQWPSTKFDSIISNCDILINSTPLGMYPNVQAEPQVDWPNLTRPIAVCDLIYTPTKTNFLLHAEQQGHLIINGMGMLVEQGAAAFTLWTGVQAPTEVMYAELARKKV